MRRARAAVRLPFEKRALQAPLEADVPAAGPVDHVTLAQAESGIRLCLDVPV